MIFFCFLDKKKRVKILLYIFLMENMSIKYEGVKNRLWIVRQ